MPPGKKAGLPLAPRHPTSTPAPYWTHGSVLRCGGIGSIFGGGHDADCV